MPKIAMLGAFVLMLVGGSFSMAAQGAGIELKENWLLNSTCLVKEGGETVSSAEYVPSGWHPTQVPSTVLQTLINRGVYPDVRVGLNSFRIPDASEEFNRKHDLAKFSHLPRQRNPWLDPYWYRTEFMLPDTARGKRVWLNFDGIHYRADVWLNGRQVADSRQIVGSFSRYRLDVSPAARIGQKNCLAVKIHQMDHPGVPDTQLAPFGKDRPYRKESMKDVGLAMFIGYDCMPTVPDRNMGLWQRVSLDFTGPVDIRHPFVVTRLPLPKTSPARLTVSAELVNATSEPVDGILRGIVEETGGQFERPVRLAAGETRAVTFSPEQCAALVIPEPRLWWPRHYGPQNVYHLSLRFDVAGQCSDEERTTMGIRQVTKEMHVLDGSHGLRLHVNGQKVFCRGGYIQPEILFAWDARRMEAEIRYLAEANINLVFFEDIPNPPDEFLDLCDRYGLMLGNCFYGCYWMQPGSQYPLDLDLLARGTVDIIKRYRNHPSLVLYMAMNEGETREDVYTRWRKEIVDRDGTRLFIPSGSFPDYRKKTPEWIKPDLPTGMNDYPPKSYGWVEPAQFFRWVRENRNWMFMLESGCPSPPPIDSLRRFLPGVEDSRPDGSPTYPLDSAWAHHDACHYFKPFDAALRKRFGQPSSVVDYCAKANLLSAEQHRAMFEAANHRMWDITSGFSEWKLNACWPSVEWQIYDWYLRPMVSYYFIKKACEPLHVQLTPLDMAVTVVNHRIEPKGNLAVRARVYDFAMKLLWEKTARVEVPANAYREVFSIPTRREGETAASESSRSGSATGADGTRSVPAAMPIRFVMLDVKDGSGSTVSDNFYWLSDDPAALAGLERLPAVRLRSSWTVEREGRECVARVRLENPTNRLAMFVHAILTKGPGGDEILPVFWNDNYVSLLPGESKQLCARFAADDLGAATASLELGGWNVETDYRCQGLHASKSKVKAGEPFTLTARIAGTCLDGSRVTLRMDNEPIDTTWASARGARVAEASFRVTLARTGRHQLTVGKQSVAIDVE